MLAGGFGNEAVLMGMARPFRFNSASSYAHVAAVAASMGITFSCRTPFTNH